MAPFFSSKSSDNAATGVLADKGDDTLASTPAGVPVGTGQEPLNKGIRAAVAKGLEDHETRPDKSAPEIVETVTPEIAAEMGLTGGVAEESQGASGDMRGGEQAPGEGGTGLVDGLGQKAQLQGHRKGRGVAAAAAAREDNGDKERATRSGAGGVAENAEVDEATAAPTQKAEQDDTDVSPGRSVSSAV